MESAMLAVRRFASLPRTRSTPTQLHTRLRRAHSTAAHASKSGIKTSHAAAAALSASFIAYTLGAFYPPELIQLISPRPAPPPPDPALPSSLAYTAALEAQLQALPALKKLRDAPDAGQWYETRPYLHIPEERRVNTLTAGALRGPGKLALPPLLRVKEDESETVGILHFGRGLCGHDGIVHGGLIATVFDESLGRLSIMNVPEKVAVTATLTVDYKAPTRADQFVIFRCKLVELKGRKAYVEGTAEDEHGNILATARGLFVQPKYAHLLNTTHIRSSLGERPANAAAEFQGGDPVPIPDETEDGKQ